jgi:hypothetical protein
MILIGMGKGSNMLPPYQYGFENFQPQHPTSLREIDVVFMMDGTSIAQDVIQLCPLIIFRNGLGEYGLEVLNSTSRVQMT